MGTEQTAPAKTKGVPLALYGAILLILPAIIALIISVVLPSLGRARELNSRTTCAANLKNFGLSSYRQTSSTVNRPAGCPHTSVPNYVLLKPPPDPVLNPAGVIAYEPLENHGEGCNVMYADGHIDWLTGEGYEKYIKPLQTAVTTPSE